jgi:hypothetical protein
MQNANKRTGGVAQEVEHLPTVCEALDSTPVLQTKKKGRKEKGRKGGRKEGRKEERTFQCICVL